MKLGYADATDEQMITALKKSNAWEFLDSKGGIDLHVGAAGG
jgi:ABC-type multidrug transport system fused ATPase/permease subunit